MTWLETPNDDERPAVKRLLLDDGALPWTGIAFALVILWVLFVAVEVYSPSRLYWTGKTTEGVNRGGVVYYHVKGELYTVDDRGYPPKHPTPQTVWYDPAEPNTGLLSGPTRYTEAVVFLGLPTAALAWKCESARPSPDSDVPRMYRESR